MTVIFSTIPSDKRKTILIRSFFQSLLGICLIGIAPLKILSSSFCFLLGILIIASSFKPYRSLRNLENRPHVLTLQENYWWFQYHKSPLFRIKVSNIRNIKYQETKSQFGIFLTLATTKALTLLQKNKLTISIMKKLIKINQDDKVTVFLPYFSATTSLRLKEHLDLNDSATNEIVHP